MCFCVEVGGEGGRKQRKESILYSQQVWSIIIQERFPQDSLNRFQLILIGKNDEYDI